MFFHPTTWASKIVCSSCVCAISWLKLKGLLHEVTC